MRTIFSYLALIIAIIFIGSMTMTEYKINIGVALMYLSGVAVFVYIAYQDKIEGLEKRIDNLEDENRRLLYKLENDGGLENKLKQWKNKNS